MKKLYYILFAISFLILNSSIYKTIFAETVEFELSCNETEQFNIDSDYPVYFRKMDIRNNSRETVKDFWIYLNDKNWSNKEGVAEYLQSKNRSTTPTIHQKVMMVYSFIERNMYPFHTPIANWKLHDAVFNLNIFGYGLCDDYSHIMEGVVVDYLNILPQKYSRVQALKGHVVPEFFYNNRWHSPDANISYYTYKGHECLGVRELSSSLTSIIRTVFPGKKGENLAQIYSTKKNNSIIQKWRYPSPTFRWNIKPGEVIKIYYDNWGKYYSKTKISDPPPTFSNGKILLPVIKNFPESFLNYHNIKKETNILTLSDQRSTGSLICRIESPYIITDSELMISSLNNINEEDIEVMFSRDMKKWDSLKILNTEKEVRVNIGQQKHFSNIYDFYQSFFLKIVLHSPLFIENMKIITDFQINTKSLPDLVKGMNKVHRTDNTASTPSLFVSLEYKKENFQIAPPVNLRYNP